MGERSCPKCNEPLAPFESSCGKCRYSTLGGRSNGELMLQAREALRGNWNAAVVAMLVHVLIISISSFAAIGPFVLSGPMMVGLAGLYLAISRGQAVKFEMLFEGFQAFFSSLGAVLLGAVLIFLWSLLLIVPGIIAGFAYSMAFHLIADNPEIGPLGAIRRSRELMRGHKRKLFCLTLRFGAWMLLGACTAGIAYIWILPYLYAGLTEFYEDIKVA